MAGWKSGPGEGFHGAGEPPHEFPEKKLLFSELAAFRESGSALRRRPSFRVPHKGN